MRRRCYVFGAYRLDPVARTVFRDDKPLALTPKAVETLTVLVENSREVVPKETLLNRVWAGTFVADGSLMRNISDLRKVLAHGGQPDCIDTVPRRGYRFNAEVREVEYTQELRRCRVAVLPLRLLDGDARDGAVGSAVVEAVITKLSSLRGCEIHSTTAVARHSEDDPVAIGRELRVDFVLDGSIRRNEDKIRVSVRLLPTTGAATLWAETLEEPCERRLCVRRLDLRRIGWRTGSDPDERRTKAAGETLHGKCGRLSDVPEGPPPLGNPVAGRAAPRHRSVSPRDRHRPGVRARLFRAGQQLCASADARARRLRQLHAAREGGGRSCAGDRRPAA